ncbi:MAG TPA: Hpt domain-containing protein [Polyangiaceae bacterium]|nr:Hpt domain-containing protein [Polyangiaceae bacterium]
MSTDPRPLVARSPAAAKLLPRFVAHRADDVANIRLALERGDYALIARLGHNMRGNGRSYGFADIATIGERMEAAAVARDATGVREQVVALEDWVVRSAPLKD